MAELTLGRRRFLAGSAICGGIIIGASALVLPRPALSGSTSANYTDVEFAVWRKGKDIGRHSIRFGDAIEGGKRADVHIDIAVKVAFITAFRFEQVGVETWTDDVLIESDVRTDDDGTKSHMTARREGDTLAVAGPEGALDVPFGTMTDLAFWHRGIVEQQFVIDAGKGKLTDIESQVGAKELIKVLGQPIETTRFNIGTTGSRSGTIWFDSSARWVKGVIHTRGETLEYELVA